MSVKQDKKILVQKFLFENCRIWEVDGSVCNSVGGRVKPALRDYDCMVQRDEI